MLQVVEAPTEAFSFAAAPSRFPSSYEEQQSPLKQTSTSEPQTQELQNTERLIWQLSS